MSTYPSNLPEVGCIITDYMQAPHLYDIATFKDDYFNYNVHNLAGVSRKRLAHFKTNVYLARSQLVRIPSARLTDSLNPSKHAWQRSYMNSKHVKSTDSSAAGSSQIQSSEGCANKNPKGKNSKFGTLYESMNLLEFTTNCRMIGS